MEFSVREPDGRATPLVVEVPHAGLYVDATALSTLLAPANALGRDADLYVDELFQDVPSDGAALIASRVSRYVVDLNRAENDYDALAVESGSARVSPHGLIWRTTTEGRSALLGPLPRSEVERRLEPSERVVGGAIAHHDHFANERMDDQGREDLGDSGSLAVGRDDRRDSFLLVVRATHSGPLIGSHFTGHEAG